MVNSAGTLYVWGQDKDGQLGLPTNRNSNDITIPTEMKPIPSDWTKSKKTGFVTYGDGTSYVYIHKEKIKNNIIRIEPTEKVKLNLEAKEAIKESREITKDLVKSNNKLRKKMKKLK